MTPAGGPCCPRSPSPRRPLTIPSWPPESQAQCPSPLTPRSTCPHSSGRPRASPESIGQVGPGTSCPHHTVSLCPAPRPALLTAWTWVVPQVQVGSGPREATCPLGWTGGARAPPHGCRLDHQSAGVRGGSEVVTPAFSQTTAQPGVSGPGLRAPVQLCRPSQLTSRSHPPSLLCKFLGTHGCTHVP